MSYNKEPSDMGSVRAFKRYQEMLIDMGVTPKNLADGRGDPTDLAHLLWMCNHCIPNIRDDGRGMSIDKYSRWLGYIQGVLIARGLATVEEERNQTRQFWSK